MTETLKRRRHTPRVIAHRGLSNSYPENTMPAFEAAIAAGADMVELDFHCTSDRHLVCVHDGRLDRYRSGPANEELLGRPISSLTLAEVQSFDAGSWKDRKFAGVHFPLLDDVLKRFSTSTDLPLLVIERKDGNASQLFDLLQRHGLLERVVVQSFDWDFLRDFRSISPLTAAAVLGECPLTQRELGWAKALGVSIVHWWANEISLPLVERCHAMGLLLWAFTINTEMAWRGALQMHVDGITTDRCDAAMQLYLQLSS